MRIGIVGHESAKFTPEGEAQAKETIRRIFSVYVGPTLVSGHSPLGGIDIWAEEIAKEIGAYDPKYIFEPKQNAWGGVPYGFRARNIDIAIKYLLSHITFDFRSQCWRYMF